MNMIEYEKVKGFNYSEYCDYLREKYGVGRADYMTKGFVYNIKSSRTLEGLIAHHIFEDHAIMLSEEEYARNNPYEWQLAKNLIYCDYLEHLFLHILICEFPAKGKNEDEFVGIGGVVNMMIPQLNDLFSGWCPKRRLWMLRCFNRIKENKDVYFALLKRFKLFYKDSIFYDVIVKQLCSGYNAEGNWPETKDKEIFNEIKKL